MLFIILINWARHTKFWFYSILCRWE